MATFIQRFLKKDRPEDISYPDFQAFLSQRVEEHQNLEYKSGRVLVDATGSIRKQQRPGEIVGFVELAKSVAGFANAEGGLLILGVNEKEERYRGSIVRIIPGAISPLPITVKREDVENGIQAKIQYPVDGLTIVPLRSSPRSKTVVYLIDVPQSARAPHRVDERYYYQRYNFSTIEMKHYQIADLFGQRLAPDLDVELQQLSGVIPPEGHFRLTILVHNLGRAVAKYATCLCRILAGEFEMVRSDEYQLKSNNRIGQYSPGFNRVFYPDLPNNTGYIEFKPLSTGERQSLTLEFTLLAEGMTVKKKTIHLVAFYQDGVLDEIVQVTGSPGVSKAPS
jgi:hypothetical protein